MTFCILANIIRTTGQYILISCVALRLQPRELYSSRQSIHNLSCLLALLSPSTPGGQFVTAGQGQGGQEQVKEAIP